MKSTVLDLQRLTIDFEGRRVVDELSIALRDGEITALVGQTGAGKTLVALTLLGFIPSKHIRSGRLQLLDIPNALGLNPRQWERLRGTTIGLMMQNSHEAFDPLYTVGSQITESMRSVLGIGQEKAKKILLSEMAELSLERDLLKAYPHELSGGELQRFALVWTLVLRPRIAVLDEPLAALDTALRPKAIAYIVKRQREWSISLLWITHQVHDVLEHADRMAIMRKGKVIESGKVVELYRQPQHHYTRKLFQYAEILNDQRVHFRERAMPEVHRGGRVLEVKDLYYRHPRFRDRFLLRGLRFSLAEGQSLGIVGPSGVGKSTLALLIAGLLKPDRGEIWLKGIQANAVGSTHRHRMRHPVQIIWQHPSSSLHPYRTVRATLYEALQCRPSTLPPLQIGDLLRWVELEEDVLDRYPRHLSGGQQQRVSIARALAVGPEVLLCDEPVSALDMATRLQILQLLQRIQAEQGLSILYVSHALGEIAFLCRHALRLPDQKWFELSVSGE